MTSNLSLLPVFNWLHVAPGYFLDLDILPGLLVVSSTESVPLEQFLKLSQEQHRIQHSGEYTNPKWFIPNTLKYYVLLHDMSEGNEER